MQQHEQSHNAEGKKLDTRYIVYDFTYINFKNRQDYSMGLVLLREFSLV